MKIMQYKVKRLDLLATSSTYFYLFIPLFKYAIYPHMCTCLCIKCPCVSTWIPEVNVRWLSLSLFPLFLRQSFTGSRSLVSQIVLPVTLGPACLHTSTLWPVLGLQTHATMPGFVCVHWILGNSAYKANPLPAEPDLFSLVESILSDIFICQNYYDKMPRAVQTVVCSFIVVGTEA